MSKQDPTYNAFLTTLKHLLSGRYHGNKSALARDVSLSSGYITNIFNGTKQASYEAQVKIAESLGFDLFSFWKLGNSLQAKDSLSLGRDTDGRDLVYIPKTQTVPPTSGGYIDFYPFKRDWIDEKGSPKNLLLMDVIGDGMMPILHSGDMVMFDISKVDLMPERIYVVDIEGLTYLKYIDREPGQFVLRSHNADYPPIYIDSTYFNTESFQIIGCVIWWCHNVNL